VPPMLHARQQLALSGGIPGPFVGNDHTRNIPEFLEQLAQDLLSGPLVAAALDEDTENCAMLIHCPPDIV